MMSVDPWLVLGGFVLIAYTIEAITGFGSIVIALALGALLLPISEMLPVLVPLNVVMTGYLTFLHWRHIDCPLLIRTLLPLMLLGTLVGYLLVPWLGHGALQILLGGLIIWFSIRQLRLLLLYRTPAPHGSGRARLLILGAGTTHGLFASGGPMLVAALAGMTVSVKVFRATLLCVWLTLNSVLTALFIADGSFAAHWQTTVLFVPVVLLGAWCGNRIHPYLNERTFRIAVFTLLGIIGAALMIGA